jgi:hypothetical protein
MDKNWTKRGVVTQADKDLISVLVKENKVAGRIFVTGEVSEKSLGKIASSLLYASNDTLVEPLFIQTKQATVQMTRFDPNLVWPCIHPDTLASLMGQEGKRLGLTTVRLDEWDYYRSLILHLRLQYGELQVPLAEKKDLETFYQAVYLGCLFLFDKGGYMAVPVSRHFALPETEEYMRNECKFRALKKEEADELLALREKYGDVQGITNPELNYLLKLHDRG